MKSVICAIAYVFLSNDPTLITTKNNSNMHKYLTAQELLSKIFDMLLMWWWTKSGFNENPLKLILIMEFKQLNHYLILIINPTKYYYYMNFCLLQWIMLTDCSYVFFESSMTWKRVLERDKGFQQLPLCVHTLNCGQNEMVIILLQVIVF